MHPSFLQGKESNGLPSGDGWKEETLEDRLFSKDGWEAEASTKDESPKIRPHVSVRSQQSGESHICSSWGASVTSQSEGPPMRRRLTFNTIVKEAVSTPYTVDDCLFDTAREKLLVEQPRLQKFVRSQTYEMLSGLLIALNAICIGVQTEHTSLAAQVRGLSGQTQHVEEDPAFLFLLAIFTVLFTIEFCVRWASEGFCGLFHASDASWSYFDMAIITLSWIDSFVSILYLAQEKGEIEHFLSTISVMRILRVARIVKLARVIRLMAFFRELRLMVYSILGSMKSLLWLTLILGSTFYIFGITFTSGTISHITPEVLWNDDALLGLRDSFGTLGRRLLSLYMAMSGGRSWGEFYHFLEDHLPAQYPALFPVFLTFTIFAVMNMVTGVFVELAMRANFNNRQVVINEELESKKELLRDLHNLFHEMDENGDGSISYEEFRHRFADERVIAYFKALKLDVHDTRALFHLLDVDGSQDIDMREFLEGCYELQGEARSIDTKMIRLTLDRIVRQIEVLRCAQDEQKAGLDSVVKRLHHNRHNCRSSGAESWNSSTFTCLSNGHAGSKHGATPASGASRSKNGATLASCASGTDKATVEDSEDPSVRRIQVIASKPRQRADMLNEMRRHDRDKDVFQGDAWDAHLHQLLAVDSGSSGGLSSRANCSMWETPKRM